MKLFTRRCVTRAPSIRDVPRAKPVISRDGEPASCFIYIYICVQQYDVVSDTRYPASKFYYRKYFGYLELCLPRLMDLTNGNERTMAFDFVHTSRPRVPVSRYRFTVQRERARASRCEFRATPRNLKRYMGGGERGGRACAFRLPL